MRVLTGGLVGAVIGAIVLAVAAINGLDALWVALPVGVACGLCVSLISGRQGNIYLRGAVAALALLVAVIGGKLSAVPLLQGDTEARVVGEALPEAALPPVTATDPGDAPEQPAAEAEEAVEAVETEATAVAPSPVVRKPAQSISTLTPITAANYSLADGIWLAISALLAYQLGKGAGGPAVNTAGDTSKLPDEPQPAEQTV